MVERLGVDRDGGISVGLGLGIRVGLGLGIGISVGLELTSFLISSYFTRLLVKPCISIGFGF